MLYALRAVLESTSCPNLTTVGIEAAAYPDRFHVYLSATLEKRARTARRLKKLRIRVNEPLRSQLRDSRA